MPFKPVKVLQILLLLLAFTNCSYFFDQKERAREVSYQLEVGSCFLNANRVLSHYVDAEDERSIHPSDFDYLGQCYSGAIEAIVQYTRSGRVEADHFSAENIFRLLNRLYPDVTLSQEKIAELLVLKHFLIGGSPETISKEELDFLKVKALPVFADVLKSLNVDRVALLRGLWLSSTEPDFVRDEDAYRRFDQLHEKLKDGTDRLLTLFQSRGQDRHIELVQILRLLSFGSGPGQGLEIHLPLFQAFKNLALNDEGPLLKKTDLGDLVDQSLVVFKMMSRFRYFMKDEGIFNNIATIVTYLTRVPTLLKDSSVFKGVALRALHDSYDQAGVFLRRSIDRSAQHHLDYDQVGEVLIQLQASQLLKNNMNADALNIFIRRFLRQWMPDSDGQNTSLTRARVDYLLEVIQVWVRRQQLVNTIFARQSGTTINLREVSAEFSSQADFRTWSQIFNKVSLHQWDDEHAVAMYTPSTDRMSYEDFTASNSQWLLVQFFTKRYNLDKQQAFDYVISSEQAQEIYELLRVLGVEMGFMDSREYNSGRRSFRESNNFSTQRANDQKMDFFESYEYLSVAFSAGPLADAIHLAISDSCYLDYRDVLERPVIKTDCFRRFIRENFEKYFNHLTTVQDFWRDLPAEDKEKFVHTLEIASRGGVISEKPVDMGEIRVMVSVVYYLQSIFYNFDLDRNGTIEGIELRNAERHFHELIVEFILGHPKVDELMEKVNTAGWWLVSINWDDTQSREDMARLIAPKVFIFLLERGRLPVGFRDNLRFGQLLKQETENAAYLTTRARLQEVLSVFSAIAEITHASHLSSIVRFLEKHQPELVQEISQSQPPHCLDSTRKSRFCEWARVIFCTEKVNGHLFQWMRENRFAFFQEALRLRDPQESIRHTMEPMSLIFRSHVRFSTQCGFPQVPETD